MRAARARAPQRGGVRSNAAPFAVLAVVAFGAVAAARVSQHAFQMEPCAWCVLQRLIFVVLGIVALAGMAWQSWLGRRLLPLLLLALAGCARDDEGKGPAERVGKALDQATAGVTNSVKDEIARADDAVENARARTPAIVNFLRAHMGFSVIRVG